MPSAEVQRGGLLQGLPRVSRYCFLSWPLARWALQGRKSALDTSIRLRSRTTAELSCVCTRATVPVPPPVHRHWYQYLQYHLCLYKFALVERRKQAMSAVRVERIGFDLVGDVVAHTDPIHSFDCYISDFASASKAALVHDLWALAGASGASSAASAAARGIGSSLRSGLRCAA